MASSMAMVFMGKIISAILDGAQVLCSIPGSASSEKGRVSSVECRERIKSMTRQLFCLALCALLFALCSSVEAQQPAKLPRIGYVELGANPNNPGTSVEAFRQGLRGLGYIEGKNILTEYRFLEGERERIPSIVAELVQLKPDVLVTDGPPVIRAIKQATKTIPIVIVTSQDPVAAGYVD